MLTRVNIRVEWTGQGMYEFEWKIERQDVAGLLESVDLNDLDSLEYLSHVLLLTLEKYLGGPLQPFQVHFCREEFCNTDAYMLNPPFQPVVSDVLEVRSVIDFWKQDPKVAMILQFFDSDGLVTPFSPRHNAVIQLDLSLIDGQGVWRGGWVRGDGPGEWEGPPQRHKFDRYTGFVYQDRDEYIDDLLGQLAAERMTAVREGKSKLIPWDEMKSKYNLG